MAELVIALHDCLPFSWANGPGCRSVFWVQGCSLGCPQCFNPATHDFSGGRKVSPARLLAELLVNADRLEGITLSGGEPFDQRGAVLEFLRLVREETKLSIVCFSGYTLVELERARGWDPQLVDVLIAGRYRHQARIARGLAGSANKEFHFFSNRYSASDFSDVPEAEIVIDSSGDLVLSGIEPIRW
jgi:anaerobic ribonucleoside-triphosphate reductase activating protein